MDILPCTTKGTNVLLTKENIRKQLQSGLPLGQILAISWGQDCPIFKSDSFYTGPVVIYIPDLWLNELPYTRAANEEEITEILSHCYTGDDFLHEMDGDLADAESLFWYCDWQHPSSAADELEE